MLNDKNKSPLKTLVEEFVHDIQTPVTSINGFVELMLDDKAITGDSREYLQIIMQESERMAEMIKAFSKAVEVED